METPSKIPLTRRSVTSLQKGDLVRWFEVYSILDIWTDENRMNFIWLSDTGEISHIYFPVGYKMEFYE